MIMDLNVTRTISRIMLALGVAVLGFLASDAARAQSAGRATTVHAAPTVLLAQLRPARARTRIRVVPAYPYRLYSTTYPVPYKYDFPGPGAVRQCNSWLAPENRASGPVIVPRMRCWWER
jgi:hypothetical protein